MFGDDLRQKFIWVDGMTEDEATSYAKKEFPAILERLEGVYRKGSTRHTIIDYSSNKLHIIYICLRWVLLLCM
jgi:hypothetical protein